MSDWGWLAFHRPSSESLEELVAALERTCLSPERPDAVLNDLVFLTFTRSARLSSEQLLRLAACLAHERIESGRPDFDEDATLATLLLYQRLMVGARDEAVEAMRWLLAQPPLGALPTCPYRGSFRFPANALDAPRALMDRDWPIRGAKLIVIEVLERHGDGSDPKRFRVLLENDREDPWTLCEAGVAMLRWGGSAVADEVAAACLEPRLVRHHGYDWRLIYAERPASGGKALLPYIIANLGSAIPSTREQAVILLRGVGRPAVSAIVAALIAAEEALRGTDPHKRAALYQKFAAEDALRAIDPQRLRELRRQQRMDNRGLSRAEPPAGEIERGLSRPEE